MRSGLVAQSIAPVRLNRNRAQNSALLVRRASKAPPAAIRDSSARSTVPAASSTSSRPTAAMTPLA